MKINSIKSYDNNHNLLSIGKTELLILANGILFEDKIPQRIYLLINSKSKDVSLMNRNMKYTRRDAKYIELYDDKSISLKGARIK